MSFYQYLFLFFNPCSKIHELLISGAELYSMYVGEGEALLRNTFQRARLAAPSIIFFDEADVVAAKRLVGYKI